MFLFGRIVGETNAKELFSSQIRASMKPQVVSPRRVCQLSTRLMVNGLPATRAVNNMRRVLDRYQRAWRMKI